MKRIAVTSTGQNLEHLVDQRFGRCEYFIIVQLGHKGASTDKIIQNPYQRQDDAEIAATQLMADEKVEVVITGDIKPCAYKILNAQGIEMYSGSGNAKESVEEYLQGLLTKLEL